MEAFKDLQAYLETKKYNNAIPIGSDAKSLEDIKIILTILLHYPGHHLQIQTQKLIEEGLCWRSRNGFIG